MEAAFDVFLHAVDEEAAQIEGGVFAPGALWQLVDVGAQHGGGEGSGIGGDDAVGISCEVGEKAGELGGPEGEVCDGRPDGFGGAGVHVVEDGGEEAEETFVGFVGGEEVFADFGDEIEGEGGVEAVEEAELGLEELAVIEGGEFAGFFEGIRKVDEGEAFEAGAKGVFGFAGAIGDAAEFAEVAGEERDDEVGFAEGVGAEDVGFTDEGGHGGQAFIIACMCR